MNFNKGQCRLREETLRYIVNIKAFWQKKKIFKIVHPCLFYAYKSITS